MYTKFFNLNSKPFELTPNPAFLYQSGSHRKALNYLNYGLYERAGFILLTGEVGSGKTTLVRNIVNEMADDVALSLVFNTKASGKQILAMINEDFGLVVAGKEKIALLRDLNDFLVDLHARDRRAVIIIDEAQNLSADALEEIRLLSNLEAKDAKFLQIVLVGQPELRQIIARNEMRQLRQRISVHCQIDPLTREETEYYVYHRLETAGNRQALSWADGTFDVLFRHSEGIPRVVNIFCDFILLAAFADNTRELTVDFVTEVIDDVSWHKPPVDAALVTLAPGGPASSGLKAKLRTFEQKLDALEKLLSHKDEVERELCNHRQLLRELLEINNQGFRRMEATLEQTSRHLQMYLTGSVAESSAVVDMSNKEAPEDIDDIDSAGSQARKGLLGKLFS